MSNTTPNIFRKEYRELTDLEKAAMKQLKEAAGVFFDSLQLNTPDGRYKALAKTAAEECVMWAVKGITE